MHLRVCCRFACILALQTSLHAFADQTWLVRFGYCLGSLSDPTLTVSECTESVPVGSWYLACYSWALLVITGAGVGGGYPTPFSVAETIVVTCIQFVSAIMWALILASFCDLTTNANPAGLAFRQTIDDLNVFMESNKLPAEMRVRLRRYFHQRKNLALMTAAGEVVSKLSSSLQVEVILHCHGEWIRKVRFLKGVETGCIVQVARVMQPIVFSPYELPPPRTLYVIRSGIVLSAGHILTSGEVFGEDVCVEDRDQEFGTPARCMTYVEVLALSQSRLFQITASFSKAQSAVRRIEILYLLKRGITRVVRQARDLAARSNGESRDFVSRLIDASTNQARQALVDAGGFIQSAEALEDRGAVLTSSDHRFLKLEKEVSGLRDDVKELIAEIRGQRAAPTQPVTAETTARALIEAAGPGGADGTGEHAAAVGGAQQQQQQGAGLRGLVARATKRVL